MKSHKIFIILLIAHAIILNLVFNVFATYTPSFYLLFSVVALVSATNSYVFAYCNIHYKLNIGNVVAWFYSITIILIALLSAFMVYILRSGSIIKYPDYDSIIFMISFVVTALVFGTVIYWLSVLILNKLK